VTAALIPIEGRIFIAQRPRHKKAGLLWEFPGGKVEPGERLRDGLIREIREELCWDVSVGPLFRKVRSRFDDFSIDLYAFWCEITGGELCLREHADCHWALPSELKRYRFTPADLELTHILEGFDGLPTDCARTFRRETRSGPGSLQSP
jgi:8-oxo-dGTP diphosphatase